MKIGTKVKMINCAEAEKYPDKIWETRSEPWEVCGEMVVLLKGRAGGFSVKCLEVVPDMGEVSDGYHTFNELYHHRAVLFSVICNQNKGLAWKSKKHADGSMFDGMFIAGIKTPDGQATYHYDIDPYWNMFHVKELECAPEWDGHTPSEAIERISKIGLGELNEREN